MSGFSSTGYRTTPQNTSLYTPYTSIVLTAQKKVQAPQPYTAVYMRDWANTAFDVRATYAPDHPLRRLSKVQKPAHKPLTPLWRRVRESSGSDSSREDAREKERGFLPPSPSITAVKPQFTLSDAGIESLEADELSELFTVLRRRVVRLCKRKIAKPFKLTGSWA
jgi:hypothetical protein